MGTFDTNLDLSRDLAKPSPRSPKKQDKKKSKKKSARKTRDRIPGKYLPYALVTIAILVAILVRLYFAGLPFADDWAERSAISSLKPQIEQKVNTEHYSLSPYQKEQLIDQELDRLLGKYKDSMDQRADELRQKYEAPDGGAYLYGIDTYSYYKDAQVQPSKSLLALVSSGLHALLNSIFDISLMRTMFYIPVLFVSLTIIPLYMVTRRIAGDITAFVASILFAVHPEFMKYSLAGLADTNTLNVFFIVTITWLFVELVYRRHWIFAVSIILSLLLFWYTWSGWFIAIILLILYGSVYLVLYTMRKRSHRIRAGVAIAGFLILFLFIFVGFDFFVDFAPKNARAYFSDDGNSIWPSGFASIRELEQQDISALLSRLGGSVFVLILFAGILLSIWRFLKNEDVMHLLTAIIAFTIFALAGSRALRFLPFAIPFACILFSFGCYRIFTGPIRTFTEWLHLKDLRMHYAFVAIIFLIIAAPVSASILQDYRLVRTIKPRMDDSIYDTAVDIRNSASMDAVLFTWWDKGHFFDALAERTVLQKSTPSMPKTYWMARVLMADEQEALGLLRMLSCGTENKALNSLKGMKTSEKISIIEDLVTLDETAARRYVDERRLSVKVLKYTHCSPGETYVVLTDDMFSRFHNVQRYAMWDVQASEAALITMGMTKLNAAAALEEEYGLSKTEALELYDRTKQTQKYDAFKQHNCEKDGSRYSCLIDDKTIWIDVESTESNFLVRDFYLIDDEILHYNVSDSEESTMIVFNRDGNYHVVILSPVIAQSLYIQLMFGLPLEHFEEFSDISSPATMRVVTHRVRW